MKLVVLLVSVFAAAVSAFVPSTPRPTAAHRNTAPIRFPLKASTPDYDPLGLSEEKVESQSGLPVVASVAVAAAALASHPLVALAEEDDYEYGAVNAPPGVAIIGGILAILTALLPIALKGGEEAFEEMKERDSNKWGN